MIITRQWPSYFVGHVCLFYYMKAKASLVKVVERETGFIHGTLNFSNFTHNNLHTDMDTHIHNIRAETSTLEYIWADHDVKGSIGLHEQE